MISCKTQRIAKQAGNLEEVITRYLKSNYQQQDSFNHDYALAWSTKTKNGTTSTKYGVWDKESALLLYSGVSVNGTVAWLDNENILVEEMYGIENQDNGMQQYKINILTKVKIPIDAIRKND